MVAGGFSDERQPGWPVNIIVVAAGWLCSVLLAGLALQQAGGGRRGGEGEAGLSSDRLGRPSRPPQYRSDNYAVQEHFLHPLSPPPPTNTTH